MNRRSFLGATLAFPAICRAESLMKMVRRESGIVVPEDNLYGHSYHIQRVPEWAIYDYIQFIEKHEGIEKVWMDGQLIYNANGRKNI